MYSIICPLDVTINVITEMREWLSWWSATLPRSRPRVRVPSRALLKSTETLKIQRFRFLIFESFWITLVFCPLKHLKSASVTHKKGCFLSQIYKSIWGKAGQDVGNLFELPPDKHQRPGSSCRKFPLFFCLSDIEDNWRQFKNVYILTVKHHTLNSRSRCLSIPDVISGRQNDGASSE